MTRKEAKAILNRLGITNRFSLKTQTFLGRDTRQVLTVKDWAPNPKAGEIKAALAEYGIITSFEPAKGHAFCN